jgi:hypothetical protein
LGSRISSAAGEGLLAASLLDGKLARGTEQSRDETGSKESSRLGWFFLYHLVLSETTWGPTRTILIPSEDSSPNALNYLPPVPNLLGVLPHWGPSFLHTNFGEHTQAMASPSPFIPSYLPSCEEAAEERVTSSSEALRKLSQSPAVPSPLLRPRSLATGQGSQRGPYRGPDIL